MPSPKAPPSTAKPMPLPAGVEARQEGVARAPRPCRATAARPAPAGCRAAKRAATCSQVVEAAEERQVVAGLLRRTARAISSAIGASDALAVAEARRDVAAPRCTVSWSASNGDATSTQAGVVRQAQRCRGRSRGGASVAENSALARAAAKRGARNGAGTTLRRHSAAAAGRSPRRVRRGSVMSNSECAPNDLGQPAEVQQRRSRSCSSAPSACGRRARPGARPMAGDGLLQRRGEARRQPRAALVGARAWSRRSALQARLQPVERPSSAAAGAARRTARSRALVELGAVHRAGALDQVVRLVDQHARRASPSAAASACSSGAARRSSSCSRRPPRRPSAPVSWPR